ncbi:29851_t:CDS:1, partial [Racocetra persica]
ALDRRTFVRDIMPDETIFSVKQKIQYEESTLDPDKQELVFKSIQLEDHRILSYYKIQPESILNLTLTMRCFMNEIIIE